MTTSIAGKDGELKTVIEIDEKSKIGRFAIFCMNVGFITLVVTSIKSITKTVNKITKKGA